MPSIPSLSSASTDYGSQDDFNHFGEYAESSHSSGLSASPMMPLSTGNGRGHRNYHPYTRPSSDSASRKLSITAPSTPNELITAFPNTNTPTQMTPYTPHTPRHNSSPQIPYHQNRPVTTTPVETQSYSTGMYPHQQHPSQTAYPPASNQQWQAQPATRTNQQSLILFYFDKVHAFLFPLADKSFISTLHAAIIDQPGERIPGHSLSSRLMSLQMGR